MFPAFRINTKIDLYICSDNEESEGFNLQIQCLIGVAGRYEDVNTTLFSSIAERN
jgi:hypothetical protein